MTLRPITSPCDDRSRPVARCLSRKGHIFACQPCLELTDEFGTVTYCSIRALGNHGSSSQHGAFGRFMVLTGPGGEGWKRAAAAVSVATRVPIGAAAIGPFLDYEDLYGAWRELCGTEEDGCVLVRPDLIVGWRGANLVEDSQTALHAAMRQILALERER